MAERKPGDAVSDRDAQQHDLAYEQAGGKEMPGLYPTNDVDERKGDIAPDVAHPEVGWNDRVQPERPDETSRDGPMADPEIEHEGD
jgi:hypothetical protein